MEETQCVRERHGWIHRGTLREYRSCGSMEEVVAGYKDELERMMELKRMRMSMFIGMALRGEISHHSVIVSILAFDLPLIDLFLHVCYHIEIRLAVVFFLIRYISLPNWLGGLGH